MPETAYRVDRGVALISFGNPPSSLSIGATSVSILVGSSPSVDVETASVSGEGPPGSSVNVTKC